jgi:polysaccharide biosynthesis transport protein
LPKAAVPTPSEQRNPMNQEEREEGIAVSELLAILRRRRWYLIVPAILIFAIAVLVAVLLPPTYRSTATILIEQQQIPQDLVRTTVTSFADQRVQTISQRVMTTVNLSRIIEQYDLYSEARQQLPMSVVVQEMRNSIHLKMVSADVVDPRSGHARQASIAFTLGFDSGSPEVAQRVTDELVSLFLEENLRTRREAAREATVFLNTEAERLAEQIADLEAKVARFKEEQGESLPEMQQVNAQFLRRTEEQISRTELEARLLEDRIVLLESELARTSRFGDDLEGTRAVVTPRERLLQLELRYIELSTQKTARHPDVVQLEREINTLRLQTGGLNRSEIESMLAAARVTLEQHRRDLPESHLDVRDAVAAVAALEEQLANAQRSGAARAASMLSENPAYDRVAAQLRSTRSELQHLREKKLTLEGELSDYEARLKAAPMVEREYRALTRDYENALTRYREIRAKQMEADVAQSLEEERKSERFVLIEPAMLPIQPIKPNRRALVLVGFVLAVGGGAGAVFLKEGTGQAIYGAKQVAAITGAMPIAVVPYITTAQEMAQKRRRRVLAVLAIAGLLTAAAGAFHHWVQPLDVVAYQVLQRAGLADFDLWPQGGR